MERYKMQKKILLTRPNYDLATAYLHFFSEDLLKEIKLVKEHTPISLEGKNANRELFEKALKANPRLLILNGHGTKRSIYGHQNEVILDESNIKILDSKLIYAVVCDSLDALGDIAVKIGNAEAYIGYGANFVVVIDPTKTATISKDKNIVPFKQVYIMMISALISGLSVNESVEKTKELMRQNIREYGVYGIRDRFGDAPLIRWGLYWDLFFLNYHGNPEATF